MNSSRPRILRGIMRSCGTVGAILLLAGQTLAVELLVCESGKNRVMRYDGVTGTPIDTGEGAGAGVFIAATVPGGSGSLLTPYGIALGPDGNIYVASQGNNSIKKYDGTNGHFISTFIPTGSGNSTLLYPDCIVFGPDGNLYVSNYGKNNILKFYGPNPPSGHSPGEFIGIFVAAGTGGLNGPRGMMFGPAGTDRNLHVAAYGANKVLVYDATTGAYVRTAATLIGQSPYNMVYEQVYHDETGRDYVLGDPTAPVFEYSQLWAGNLLPASSGTIWIIGGDGTNWGAFYVGVNNPRGMAWGPHRSPVNPSDPDDWRQSLYLGNTGAGTIKVLGANEKNCGSLVSGLTAPTYILFKYGTQPATLIRQVLGNNGMQGTVHTVTLRGDGMAHLMPANGGSVMLQKMRNQGAGLTSDGTATISAVSGSYRMSGDDLLVDFDLTGAEGGRYGVIPSDPCGSAMKFPDAVLVYMPALTNGSFEEGWTPDREDQSICTDTGNGNKSRPKHWDQMKLGYWQGTGNQFDIVRDGNIWAVDCAGGQVLGITGSHYGSIQNNFNDQRAWNGMYQTITAPNLGLDGKTTTADYDIYVDALVASFQRISTGLIMLYDGDDLAFQQVITSTMIFNNQAPVPGDPDVLLRSPNYRATVPAGYVYKSDPPVLTIAFLSQSEAYDVNQDGTMAIKAVHLDNVRNTYGGCRGWPGWADADGDGDADMDDFGAFQLCYALTSADPAFYTSGCSCFDHVADNTIDQWDLVDFQTCALGAGVPVTDPNCQ